MILKNDILAKTSEKDIMEYYLGEKLQDNKAKYRNPTRGDLKGTCYFKWIRGKYILHDRARGIDANFDCFQYVMWKYDCKFVECLQRINGDMKLGITTEMLNSRPGRRIKKKSTKSLTPRKVNFQVKTRGWRKEDLNYWKQYHISIENLNKVMQPVSSYKTDSGGSFKFTLRYRHTLNNPCYIYTFKGPKALRVKLYQPKSKECKWRSNTNTKDIFGYDHIHHTGNTLYIASGGKDMLCLWEMGLNAIAFQSESTIPSDDIINNLKKRYKNIYVLYDNDNTGVEMAKKISAKHNLTNIILPNIEEHIKDVAEFVKEFGLAKTLKIILDEQRKRNNPREHKRLGAKRTTSPNNGADSGSNESRYEYDSPPSECSRIKSN